MEVIELSQASFLQNRLELNKEVAKRFDFSDDEAWNAFVKLTEKKYKFILALHYQKGSRKLLQILYEMGVPLKEDISLDFY